MAATRSKASQSKGDPEQAARLRAAFAYARLDKTERAEVLGLSVRQVGRLESAEAEIDPRLWPRVIEATGVPEWFITDGFAAAPEPEEPSIAERVEALEEQVKVLVKQTERVYECAATVRLRNYPVEHIILKVTINPDTGRFVTNLQ